MKDGSSDEQQPPPPPQSPRAAMAAAPISLDGNGPSDTSTPPGRDAAAAAGTEAEANGSAFGAPNAPPTIESAFRDDDRGGDRTAPPSDSVGGGGKSPADAKKQRERDETAQMRRVLGRIRRQKRGGRYAQVDGESSGHAINAHGDDRRDRDHEGGYELTPPISPNRREAVRKLGEPSGFVVPVGDDYGDDSGFEVLEVTTSFGVEENTWFQMMCPKPCRLCLRICRRGTCFCGSSDENEDIDDIARSRPTNEMLLTTAFVSFMGFTLLQSFVAYIAKSEAMMGDSAAMAVDALTYAFNLIAERMKNRTESEMPPDAARFGGDALAADRARRAHARSKKKLRLQLELVPPLVSVTTLIAVIGVVLQESVKVLILDAHRSEEEQSNPNVLIMVIFSALNLGLDFLNVFCFARARHAMGFATTDEEDMEVMTAATREDGAEGVAFDGDSSEAGTNSILSGGEGTNGSSSPSRRAKKSKTRRIKRKTPAYAHLPSSLGDDAADEERNVERDGAEDVISPCSSLGVPELENGEHGNGGQAPSIPTLSNGDVGHHEPGAPFAEDAGHHAVNERHHSHERANLNMCSAYTHVFADTLRSIAVVIASMLAMLVDGITAEVADSTAAVVVCTVILLSLLPLFHGMLHTWSELRQIRKEEAAERDLPDPMEMLAEADGGSTAPRIEMGMGFA